MLKFGVIADVGGLCILVLVILGVYSFWFFVAIDWGGAVVLSDIFFVGGLFSLGLFGFWQSGSFLFAVFCGEHCFLITDIIVIRGDVNWLIVVIVGVREY